MAAPVGFPKLLRQSRFASFDPTIRQSYGTPHSHLHRGNWGLKRPIAQRKRNAFISLKNFEEHENYIEWDNAETEVRLIDKIEEINVAPKLVPNVPWFVGLGPAASSFWSKMDTEFAPGETGMPPLPNSVPLFTTQLEGLGLRGKGEYGMKPSLKPSNDGYLHPNVSAMTPKVFKRYVKKLRSLRPEFKKFLEENGVNTAFREAGLPLGNLHIRFLGQHFEKQYQDTLDENKTDAHPNQPQPIRQQPHRLAGLMYSSPTNLESFFNSAVQPAIVLEDGSKTYYTSTGTANSLLASTAGIVGRLDSKKAGPNVGPAFDNRGIAFPPAALLAGNSKIPNPFINVKVVDLQLERPPVAVTPFPSAEDRRTSRDSLRNIRIRMDLVGHSSDIDHSRTNTHPPGSMLYNAPYDSQQQLRAETIYNPEGKKNRYGSSSEIMNKLLEQRVPPNDEPQGEKNQEEEKPPTSKNDAHMLTLEKVKSTTRRPENPVVNVKQKSTRRAGNPELDDVWNRPRKVKWKNEMFADTNYDDDDDDGNTGQVDDGNTPV